MDKAMLNWNCVLGRGRPYMTVNKVGNTGYCRRLEGNHFQWNSKLRINWTWNIVLKCILVEPR